MNISASTLRYRLIEGPLRLEPLRILAARSAHWQEGEITFYALGASHAVRFQQGNATLTELLACATLEKEAGVLMDIAGKETQKACRIIAGIVCRVELIPFLLTEGESLQAEYPASDRLEVAYPALAGTPTPYTRIGWRITRDELTVETVHTYPEENLGIRSRSHFHPEEAGR